MSKKEKIPAAVRNGVWHKYIGGLYYSKCFCCNFEPITKSNYECGHIVSEKNGGKVHLNNLRPVCSSCNKSIGTRNMEHFMEQYGFEKNENWYGIDKKKISNDNTKKIHDDYMSADDQPISCEINLDEINLDEINPDEIKPDPIDIIHTNKINGKNICKHKYVNGTKKGTYCDKSCRGDRCKMHKKNKIKRRKEYYQEKKKEVILIPIKNTCKHKYTQGSKKGYYCDKSCRGNRCTMHKKNKIIRRKEYHKEKLLEKEKIINEQLKKSKQKIYKPKH
jgi:hypothetical protein